MIINNEILKFISLEISAFEFEKTLKEKKEIIQQLESLMPDKSNLTSDSWNKIDAKDVLIKTSFNIMDSINMFGGFNKAMGRATAYTLIYDLVSLHISNIKYNDYYDQQFSFFLDTVPNYIGGLEAEMYIDKLYNKLPNNVKLTEKKKLFKTQLKELFKYKTKKPVWIQEPEWPVTDSPLEFIKQEYIGDLCKYYFYNPKLNCFKIIEQYY